MDLRIHRLPDQFLVSSGVQSFVHLLADRQQCFPIRLLLGVALWNSGIAQDIFCRRKLFKMNAGGSRIQFRQILPDLFACEAHDWREQAHQSLSDPPDSRLCSAALP